MSIFELINLIKEKIRKGEHLTSWERDMLMDWQIDHPEEA